MSAATPRTSAATIASIQARHAAAEVRRGLTVGEINPVALLSSPGMGSHRRAVARVPVERLLRAVPGVGEAATREACRDARVDRSARLEALTDVQLAKLAEIVQRWDLEGYAGSGPRRRAAP